MKIIAVARSLAPDFQNCESQAAWLIGLLLLLGAPAAGCDDSSSDQPPGMGAPMPAANVLQVVVDSGPAAAGGTVNSLYASVTLCSPSAPTNCQTIDHLLVDTGSYGLRILSSVLSNGLRSALPLETDAHNNDIVECTQFADAYAWGPLRLANVQIAGEHINSLAVQIIGDPAFSALLSPSCSNSGASNDTVAALGANGILGVGVFKQDCGQTCAQAANVGVYYACNSSSCLPTTVSLPQQVQNPVGLFATDNNGVMISLPAVSSAGATSVTGTLTFGIGTQSNNGLGSAKIFSINPANGYFTTTYSGVLYSDSVIDSGSNGIFFTNSSILQCSDGSGDYCPATALNFTAVNTGQNGSNGPVNFSVASETTLLNNPSIAAFGGLSGPNGDPNGFDWGLPFFFGRNVIFALEASHTAGGVGPYVAY